MQPSCPTDPYDIAILGGGSAGCVLAARLSEDPATRVLLLEAGPDLPPDAQPAAIRSPYPGRAYFNPAWTWPALRVRLSPGSNQPTPYEQARILGGGSSINGLGANRGSPADYDEWAALGATGWGWSDVLPYFRRAERDLDFAGDLHGADGPLPVRRVPRGDYAGFAHATEAALLARGYPMGDDQNGEWQDGAYPIALNLDEHGARAGTATAYLTAAVRRRPNLQIRTGAQVERVTIRDGQAVSAQVDGQPVHARLFIVSAGALHSPALLMRSGIGPGPALQAMGIPVHAARPGVGANLHEHPSIGVSAFLTPGARLPPGERYHIQSILRWSSGLDGTPAGDMHTAVNTRSGWHATGRRIGTLFSWVNKSYSRGTVTLASPDPAAPPDVDFRLLSDPRDLHRLADAFILATAVLADPALHGAALDRFASTYSPKVKRLLRPTRANGAAMAVAGMLMDAHPALRRRILALAAEGVAHPDALAADPDALHAHLRRHAGGVWHPCGTCRLGAVDDPAAVCDPAGRVIGVGNLMVCDASVMPTIPCANLNVPVIMIAERMAALLRQA